MKLVIREYLASLREREELDAMLPNLLSEMGFTVYSRPSRGTRQYGVDIAAVGTADDGERKVYLFSVKQGDLNRQDWDGTPQALRSSLNEIRDAYIRTCIPTEYQSLPIVICLVFGGDIKEAVLQEVRGYIHQNTTATVTYEEWNGDRLADLILTGVLREGMFTGEMRGHLRKAAAMVEDPDIAYAHFQKLVDAIANRSAKKKAERITKVREIYMCLWVLFTWAREADNVEAPYRASEYAVLRAWELLKDMIGSKGREATDAGTVFNDLVELHFSIWDVLAGKILPHVDKRHAISATVASFSSLDINLKTHEIMGRIAMRGLWLAWAKGQGIVPTPLVTAEGDPLNVIAMQLFSLIDNNPALQSPISDDQAIDIALALMLLGVHGGCNTAISSWLDVLIDRLYFAYHAHGAYLTCKDSYWDLVEHPADKTDEYRKEATGGSTLYPLLALWAAAYGASHALAKLAEFKSKHLDHCNFQLWFPDEDSEAGLYRGSNRHGDMLSDIPVDASGTETGEYVGLECATNDHFRRLSAVELHHWPIVLMACRHYRLPVPPQIWIELLGNTGEQAAAENTSSSRVNGQ
jgi:hypothetical protein